MSVFAGTSGFSYSRLEARVLSQERGVQEFPRYYATKLNCVEINYTYRQLPKATTLAGWVNATPEGFLFAPKAHMKLTHILRLKKTQPNSPRFFCAPSIPCAARDASDPSCTSCRPT